MATMDIVIFVITVLAAVGAWLVAGVFFAFSTFIMRALAQVPPAAGIAAMQSINVVVVRSLFILTFLGTAAASVVTLVCGLMWWRDPVAPYLLAGSLCYLAGTFGVTMACNVPRNNALAAAGPAEPASAALWGNYVKAWTAWNHVRTAASLAAAAAFTVALML